MFFALWPDAAVRRRLHDEGGKAHASCDGRRMRRDTLHLTLAFIGDIPPSRLADLIAVGDRVRCAGFTLCLDRIAGWRHNRIVWAGASALPAALAALVAELNAGLAVAGFPVEQRKFAAHVTLVRNARSEFHAIDIASPIEWPVSGFVLVESDRREDGAHYTVMKRWPATVSQG